MLSLVRKNKRGAGDAQSKLKQKSLKRRRSTKGEQIDTDPIKNWGVAAAGRGFYAQRNRRAL